MNKIQDIAQGFSRPSKVLILTCGILLFSISVFGLIGAVVSILSAQPIADDFAALIYYKWETLGSNATKELLETGRPLQSVLSSLTYGVLGKNALVFAPFAAFVWTVSLIFAYSFQFHRRLGAIGNPWVAATFVSFTLSFVILLNNRNVLPQSQNVWFTYQSFLWVPGVLTYLVPLLMLLTVFFVTFFSLSHRPAWVRLLVLGAFTYLSSLGNEVMPVTVALSVAALLAISMLDVSLRRNRYYVSAMTVIFSSSVLGILTLINLSGSVKRQEATGATERLLSPSAIVSRAVEFLQLSNYTSLQILAITVGLVIAGLFFDRNRGVPTSALRSSLKIALVAGVITATSLLSAVTLLLWGYGSGTALVPRVFTIYQFALSVFLVCLGAALGRWLFTRGTQIVVVLALSFMLASTFIVGPKIIQQVLVQVNSSLTFSNTWIAQELKFQASSGESIPVPPSAWGLGDDYSWSCEGGWIHEAAEEYYGVQIVCERPSAN